MRSVPVFVCFAVVLALPGAAQTPEARPTLRALEVDGATVFTPTEIRWSLRLEEGAPLPQPPEELADRLRQRYVRQGYGKAEVTARFEEEAGRLLLRVDEGRVEAIAFEGVDEDLARDLASRFPVRPGDLYNTRHVARALREALAPSRGAVRLAHRASAPPGTVFQDSGDLSAATARPFDLVDRDGRRTLVIGLRRERSDFRATFGTEGREDWYSPVDGLTAAVGFSGTIYDQRRFHHTTIEGYASYKVARETAGFSLGFERPIAGGPGAPRVLVAAQAHDLTASDDGWRLSVLEQSLVALTFSNTFRDYYRERGYQVTGVVRPHAASELLVSWRAYRHEPLTNRAEYTVFRDDRAFRDNLQAADGRIRALMIGYSLDTRGLARESARGSLRRHTAPGFFGTHGGTGRGVRVEWTSELAREAFGGDFDFTRHVGNARLYLPVAPAHAVRGRLMAGLSSGDLPPQRVFALGGIGSVHGYAFKEARGERMVLGNLEYQVGDDRGLRGLAFVDLGRVYRPLAGSTPDWLTGVGVGVGLGDLRVDFGWRAADGPSSLQVLVRFGPTF
jgi:hypothetical protein